MDNKSKFYHDCLILLQSEDILKKIETHADIDNEGLCKVAYHAFESVRRVVTDGEEPSDKDVLAMDFYTNKLMPLIKDLVDTIDNINQQTKQYEYEFILAESEENDDSN